MASWPGADFLIWLISLSLSASFLALANVVRGIVHLLSWYDDNAPRWRVAVWGIRVQSRCTPGSPELKP